MGENKNGSGSFGFAYITVYQSLKHLMVRRIHPERPMCLFFGLLKNKRPAKAISSKPAVLEDTEVS